MREQPIVLPPRLADFFGAKAAPRALVESIIEELVSTLDAIDGDPDCEEPDLEDSFVISDSGRQFIGNVPGCPISDCDSSVEDDPVGFDPEEDCCLAGDDGVFSGAVIDQGGGDEREDDEDDDRVGRRPHRDFIRRTRCDRIPRNWSTGAEFRLRRPHPATRKAAEL